MVHGYHLIFGTYGTWLPNDPRGSWSEFVASWELFWFGRSPRRDENTSMLTHPTLRESRTVRQRSLKYHPVQFNGKQALAVGNGFASAVRRHQWSVWACSILPEHVHLVLARWKSSAEQAVVFFKAEASTELKKQGLHPAYLCDRSVWERGKWISFLDSETAIEDAIHYVEDNPVKEGKPKQKWSFVTPFAGLEKGWMTYH